MTASALYAPACVAYKADAVRARTTHARTDANADAVHDKQRAEILCLTTKLEVAQGWISLEFKDEVDADEVDAKHFDFDIFLICVE